MQKLASFLAIAFISGCAGPESGPAVEATKPIEAPAKVAPSISSPSSTVKQQPVVLSYPGRIRAAIRVNLAYPQSRLNDADLLSNPMAEVEVRVAPSGKIVSTRLAKSSGVQDWDVAVQRAIVRTEILPLDVDGNIPPVMLIAFRPR